MRNTDTMGNPLVSVITTVLSGAKYLETCIQSVLSQSYPNIEHIFIDGGSTDGTVDMLSNYQTKYPDRIRFISEPDKGAGDAWNKGFRMAEGKIVGWLGADDTYEPDAIMTAVEFFKVNPDAHFLFGDCNIISEQGESAGKCQVKDFDLEEAINDNCYIATPSAFYRRDVIDKVGLMDTSILACDLDYWIRAGKVFQLHRIDKVLANFRIHQDSVTGSAGIYKVYIREDFVISRRHGGSIFSPRAKRYYRLRIVEGLRPVLGRLYPFINRVLGK